MNSVVNAGYGILIGSSVIDDFTCYAKGPVYWNGSTGKLEVLKTEQYTNAVTMEPLFTSASKDFTTISSQVSLDPAIEELLRWVAVKKKEEEEFEILCDNNPTLKEMKQKMEMVVSLMRKNNG